MSTRHQEQTMTNSASGAEHISAEQRTKFIEIYNAKRMKIGYPGHFYVPPFFCRSQES